MGLVQDHFPLRHLFVEPVCICLLSLDFGIQLSQLVADLLGVVTLVVDFILKLLSYQLGSLLLLLGLLYVVPQSLVFRLQLLLLALLLSVEVHLLRLQLSELCQLLLLLAELLIQSYVAVFELVELLLGA